MTRSLHVSPTKFIVANHIYQYLELEKPEEHGSILNQRAELILQRRRDDESDLALVYSLLPEPRVAHCHCRRLHKGCAEVDEGYSTGSSLPPSEHQEYHTAIKRITTGGEDILHG